MARENPSVRFNPRHSLQGRAVSSSWSRVFLVCLLAIAVATLTFASKAALFASIHSVRYPANISDQRSSDSLPVAGNLPSRPLRQVALLCASLVCEMPQARHGEDFLWVSTSSDSPSFAPAVRKRPPPIASS